MAYEIGLSSAGKVMDEQLFAAYRDAGLSCMEISRDLYGFEKVDFADVKQLADRYGIRLRSLHLPFDPFHILDPSSADGEKRRETVKHFTELICKGAEIGVGKFVVHASIEPITDEERSERMKYAKETLALLAEIAGREGAVICVEDLPRSCIGNCSAEIADLISADDRLRVCFDTNHLMIEDNIDFVRAVGNKIVTLHVSDYDFPNERHWLPGEGTTDWQALLGALKEVGYSGPWLYEIGFRAPAHRPRSRDLTCFDFARNAREIFEGSPLTVIN